MEIRNAAGYISSSMAATDIGWGSSKCPWLITALPGQRINITMIDFQPLASSQRNCQQLGSIKDLRNEHEITICKDVKRMQHLYTSSGAQVEIRIDKFLEADKLILVYYNGKFSMLSNVTYE